MAMDDIGNFSKPAGGTLEAYMQHVGNRARAAARQLARSGTAARNQALLSAADRLQTATAAILAANALDRNDAIAEGCDDAFVDRLTLTKSAIATMADGVRQVAALADPIGEIAELAVRPSGIQVGRMRVPLGVIGMIYESRPNVTADAAALCIKSANASMLRGGSEAARSNAAIHACFVEALDEAGLPKEASQLLATQDREAVGLMLTMTQTIDVIIPRGGRGLTARIADESKVPVIKHLDGICHVYVDDDADLNMAVAIADNAKTQRYSPCNAMETLLVARRVAPLFLPAIGAIYADKGVEMRACPEARVVLAEADVPRVLPAQESDWHEEYLAPIVAIRVVEGLDEAMAHIATYGSGHTDAIVTRSHERAMRFLREVDSSSVMVNASTRLADGFEYGLGAEIGISTDKLHARGPVGLAGLTSQKWIVLGSGQIRC